MQKKTLWFNSQVHAMNMQRRQGKLYLRAFLCSPNPPHSPLLPEPPPAPPLLLHHWSEGSGYLLTSCSQKKKKHFQRLQAFLSACGNILIAIKEMTTPSLDIIKRWGAFLDTLTGVHAGTWKHVIFIGIYFVVKVMRNIFSGVITI